MKNVYTIFVLLSTIVFLNAQVKIGSDASIDPSLILKVDNSTNGGVLFPKVELGTSLTNATSPIMNPVEGLMIYHPNETGVQKEGIYIWINNRWNLVADNNNMVNDLVVLNNNIVINVLGTTVSTFENLNTLPLNLFSNNIPDATYDSNGYINLPKGDYVVNVVIDFNAPGMTSGTTIPGANGINLMNFAGKLYNPSTGEVFGYPEFTNVTLRNQSRRGQISFTFNFKTTNNKSLVFALAHSPGGSYVGSIKVNKLRIHVQSAK